MSDDKTLLSRRTVLKGSGASLGAAAVGVGGLVYSSQPALAFDGEAGTDITLGPNKHSVDDVTIAPNLVIAWDNFSHGVDEVTIEIDATVDADTGDESDEWDPAGSYEGDTVSVDFDSGDDTDEVLTNEIGEGSGTLEIDYSDEDADPFSLLAEEDFDIDNEAFPQDVEDDDIDPASDVDLEISVTAADNEADNSETEAGDDTDEADVEFTVTLDQTSADSSLDTVEVNADGDASGEGE